MPSEEEVIELSGRVAKILLENGAETSRVEAPPSISVRLPVCS